MSAHVIPSKNDIISEIISSSALDLQLCRDAFDEADKVTIQYAICRRIIQSVNLFQHTLCETSLEIKEFRCVKISILYEEAMQRCGDIKFGCKKSEKSVSNRLALGSCRLKRCTKWFRLCDSALHYAHLRNSRK